MSSMGATSFCGVPIRRIDASQFQITKRALIREAGLTVEEFAKLL